MKSLFWFMKNEDEFLGRIQKSVGHDERTSVEQEFAAKYPKELVALSVVHGREDIAGILLWTIAIKGYLRTIAFLLLVICFLLGHIAWRVG